MVVEVVGAAEVLVGAEVVEVDCADVLMVVEVEDLLAAVDDAEHPEQRSAGASANAAIGKRHTLSIGRDYVGDVTSNELSGRIPVGFSPEPPGTVDRNRRPGGSLSYGTGINPAAWPSAPQTLRRSEHRHPVALQAS
jgi:hypothetical protein